MEADMTISRFIGSALLALLAGAGLTCGAAADQGVTLQLSWKPQAEFGGLFQAKTKGFYSACGVDMTLRDGAAGIDTAQLLTAGAVDAAIVTQNDNVMRMNMAGFPARAVMANIQKFATILMYHDEAGIKTPEDMKGKPILMSQGNRATIWPFLKKKFSLKDQDLRSYNGQIALWMSNTDAIQQGVVTQEPFRVQQQTGKMPPYFLVADMGYNPYTGIIVVSQKMIDEKPAVVQCIVDASRKGLADFMKDPSAAMAVMQKLNPDSTQEVMAFTYKTLKEKGMVENEETARLGIGAMTDARWKAHYEMLVADGLMPPDFDYKQAFTTRFLLKPIN
jgi:NitT/TauT family transport system substrate-binding protein